MSCQTENAYEDRMVDAIYDAYQDATTTFWGNSPTDVRARQAVWCALSSVCEAMGLDLNAVIEECEEVA